MNDVEKIDMNDGVKNDVKKIDVNDVKNDVNVKKAFFGFLVTL